MPSEPEWSALRMDMQRHANGDVTGVLHLGLFQFHIRKWRKEPDGTLRAEYSAKLDGEWVANIKKRGLID